MADGSAGRVRRTQEERSAESRRRVIEATVASLETNGYASTTTAVVALKAGISRGGLFHQYPTKVDLMIDVVEETYREEMVAYEAWLARVTDPNERYYGLIEQMWELLQRPKGMAVLEIMVGARSDPALARRLGPLQRWLDLNSQKLVAHHMRKAGLGAFADDPAMLRLAVSAVRGLVIEKMFSEHPEELNESVKRLREMFELYYRHRADLAAQGDRKTQQEA
jgi:AcrR family transcriptional regulator